jgi:hypothetical protein
VAGRLLARTGPLMTSGTSLWCHSCPHDPRLVCWPLPLSTLSRLSLVATPAFRLRLPPIRCRSRIAPARLPGSSGFSPPRCYQASLALSPQYSTQICHPLPLTRSGSLPPRARFLTPPGNLRSQDRRTSPGKTAPPLHIPSSFTSVRFSGYQDSLSHACSSSSPQPFSWFAVRYVHGFCLMLPPDSHLWGCPCPVGVALPSGNGGLLIIRRLRHAGRTSEPPAEPEA